MVPQHIGDSGRSPSSASPSTSGLPMFGSQLVDRNSSTPYSDATQPPTSPSVSSDTKKRKTDERCGNNKKGVRRVGLTVKEGKLRIEVFNLAGHYYSSSVLKQLPLHSLVNMANLCIRMSRLC
ncbi:polyprotein, partial [Frankliniella fusca]